MWWWGGGGDSSPTPSTYTLTFYASSNGSVSGPATQIVNQGANATIVTAVPSNGYHFVNWTENGSVVSTNISLTITNVNVNHTYISNFALNSASTYSLTFAAGSNGTLSGTTSQIVSAGANSTTVTAVPATGYHFVNWTENGTVIGVSASLSISNVTANYSYVANFAPDAVAKSTSILKINLTGTLSTNTAIAGADFVLTLPANVTPALTNGSVTTGVVINSGTFLGSGISPQVDYSAALGTLHITLANTVNTGVTQVGEVATVTLQLANGVTPTAANFGLSSVNVIDATYYGMITGMDVSVASVTLQ